MLPLWTMPRRLQRARPPGRPLAGSSRRLPPPGELKLQVLVQGMSRVYGADAWGMSLGHKHQHHPAPADCSAVWRPAACSTKRKGAVACVLTAPDDAQAHVIATSLCSPAEQLGPITQLDAGSDSSEDEREPRNTVGDVPLRWYKDEEHIG